MHRRARWLPGIFARLAKAAVLTACACISACKDPVQTRREPAEGAAARGLVAIKDAGCGSCHEIPGLDWPKGRLAPSLKGFDDVGLIAGQLPNRPEVLAAFVRNAPLVKPGSTMPPMPITEQEAQDIASYLYGIDHD
ncbi:c-type cytochrome [Altererythrobacter sp. SALINAS58]|nr:c-type cytochrome [Alteripontixanthobacter muriae]